MCTVDANNGVIKAAVHAGKSGSCVIIEFPTDYKHDTSQLTTHRQTHSEHECNNNVVTNSITTHSLSESNPNKGNKRASAKKN